MPRLLHVIESPPDPSAILEAVQAILRGGLVVYPTDTSYALGANGLDPEAVKRVFQAKRRPPGKPVHLAIAGLAAMDRYADVGERGRLLAKRFLPGPLTLVLRAKVPLPEAVAPRGAAGFRMPSHPVALALAEEADVPITATSANVSGQPDPYTAEEAIAYLGETVDVVLDSGRLPYRRPSTIVDLTSDPARVLREGPLAREKIYEALGLLEPTKPRR